MTDKDEKEVKKALLTTLFAKKFVDMRKFTTFAAQKACIARNPF